MNYRVVCNILGKVLLAEAILLILPLTAAMWYHESVLPFLWTMLPLALIGGGRRANGRNARTGLSRKARRLKVWPRPQRKWAKQISFP